MTGDNAILLVEDDLDTAASVASVVRKITPCVIASSLRAADDTLAAVPCCGLIVDVNLPDGSGLDFVARVRAKDPEIPCLVMTGSVEAEFANRAHRMKVEYVRKPAEVFDFHDFVQRCISPTRPLDARMQEEVDRFCAKHALTAQETQIVEAAIANRSKREFVETQGVPEGTYKNRVRSILAKSGARDLVEVVQRIHLAMARP